jgi:hypothetical protein
MFKVLHAGKKTKGAQVPCGDDVFFFTRDQECKEFQP